MLSDGVRRIAVCALICVLTLAAAGCGGDDPRSLLAELKRIDRGEMHTTAELRLDAPGALGRPMRLSVRGPFEFPPGQNVPSLDLEVRASAVGRSVSGGLLLGRNRVYITVGDRAFDLGPEAYSEAAAGFGSSPVFGVPSYRPGDPGPGAKVEGEEDVDGTTTKRVRVPLPARAVVDAFADFYQQEAASEEFAWLPKLDLGEDARQELAASLDDIRLTLNVAEDKTVRRASFAARFEVPGELRERLGGVRGGEIEVQTDYVDVGTARPVALPSNPRPAEELPAPLLAFGTGGPDAFRAGKRFPPFLEKEFVDACAADAPRATCRCLVRRFAAERSLLEFFRLSQARDQRPLERIFARLAADCA